MHVPEAPSTPASRVGFPSHLNVDRVKVHSGGRRRLGGRGHGASTHVALSLGTNSLHQARQPPLLGVSSRTASQRHKCDNAGLARRNCDRPTRAARAFETTVLRAALAAGTPLATARRAERCPAGWIHMRRGSARLSRTLCLPKSTTGRTCGRHGHRWRREALHRRCCDLTAPRDGRKCSSRRRAAGGVSKRCCAPNE